MSKNKKNKSRTPNPAEFLGRNQEEETPEMEAPEEETPEMEAPEEETPEVEAPEEETPEVEAPEEETETETPAPKAEATTLEEIIASLPPELREKAQAEVAKLRDQAKSNQQAKAFVAFDSALKDEKTGLPRFVGALAKHHGVNLANRRITITYPDGKFAYTNSPKGKSGNGGGSGRSGFPAGWGKAELIKDGKVVKSESSASKLAETMNLQVEGMRDMLDVFNNPHERNTKAILPKIYTVDAVRGEYFRVITKK